MPTVIGTVVKSVGGYHEVRLSDGQTHLLRARGNVKRKGAILVGDRVEVVLDEAGGVVERTLPRRSQLLRPPVANVEVVIAVIAMADPDPSLELLDRILAHVERDGLEALVVINKVDLADEGAVESLAEPYRKAGYQICLASARSHRGSDCIARAVQNRLAVVAGASGVGKSTLLNALVGTDSLKTQAISHKSKRGRHTTREVTLVPLRGGGWVADAPGFSTLRVDPVDPRCVRDWYPEMRLRETGCRFAGCMHRTEPQCAVRAAVDEGEIDPGRYQRYLKLLSEVEEAYERRF